MRSPSTVAVLVCAICTLQSVSIRAQEVGTSTLRVKVVKVVPGKGEVMATLCTKDTFKGKCPTAKRVPAEGETVVFTFDGLPPGQYAVKTYQDVDGDGQMKRGSFGEPIEPWGFSNDAKGTFGPPGWDDSAVDLGPEGKEIAITLN